MINMQILLPKVNTHAAFFMGSTVSLMQKMLDFRAVNYKIVVAFNICFLVVKFLMIQIADPSQILLTACLELFPCILSFKSEEAERSLYHSLYQSKSQLIKFKQFLTDYLPNQIAILTKDLSAFSFMNNPFQKSFNSQSLKSPRESLQRFILDEHEVDKHKDLFKILGYRAKTATKPLRLLDLIQLITTKLSLIKDLESMSFQVYDEVLAPAQSLCLTDSEKCRLINKVENRSQALQRPSIFKSHKNDHSLSDHPDEDLYVKRNCSSMPLNDDPQNLSSMPKALEKELAQKETETENKSVNSVRRIFKVKLIELLWDGKESLGIVLDDVTHERTIMELKIADKNKDLVIAMVSHELRTPLNGMLGILDIIKKMLKQNNVFPYLNACRNSSLMLLNLVNSILDMSQIKNNKLRLIYTKVCLLDLLNGVKSLFDHFCMVKNLYLNIEVNPDVPDDILTDETRLRQVLINLVGNAFKFTFKGGVTIKVDLENNDPHKLRFRVEDTGIGIKKEDQAKLFKLFGRLEQQNQKINTNGVGLGLTISNTIVTLLNPSEKKGIQVSSELDQGTTFYFTIECSEQTNKEINLEKNEDESDDIFEEEGQDSLTIVEKMNLYYYEKDGEPGSGQNLARVKSKCLITCIDSKGTINAIPETYAKIQQSDSANSILDLRLAKTSSHYSLFSPTRIASDTPSKQQVNLEQDKPLCLIVDDNPFNLMVTSNIMHEKGYQVHTALNGQEAVEKVKTQENQSPKFSLILMDCQMPIMDGYKATKILKKMMRDREIKETPIIALTANNRDEAHNKLCKSVGMDGVAGKPLNPEEIKKFLEKSTCNVINPKPL